MRVGIVGTGAIASKHAQAYRNIGYEITVCTNATAVTGQKFSDAIGAEFVPTVEQLCRHPQVDYVDVCTVDSDRFLYKNMFFILGRTVQQPGAGSLAKIPEELRGRRHNRRRRKGSF